MLKAIAIVLCILSILSALMQVIKKEIWWVRIFDFPNTQVLFLALIGVPLLFWSYNSFLVWHYVLLGFSFVAIAYHCYTIYPYTRFHSKEIPHLESGQKGLQIKLMTSNIYMHNRDYASFLEVVRQYDPDLLLVVETDAAWQDNLSSLHEIYPYKVLCPLSNTYGLLFYSKLYIEESEIKFLVQEDVPSLYAKLALPDGQSITFFGVHPKPPFPGENNSSLPRDAALVLVGREAKLLDTPVIITGDLNDVAWSHTTRLFRSISGLLDPRVGRGFYNTFNAKLPSFLRWPLDHCFVSRHFRVIDIKTLPHINSDHLPIALTLSLHERHKKRLPEKEVEQSDIQEAKEKLEKANERSDTVEIQ